MIKTNTPKASPTQKFDVVNKAEHYNVHPSGIEAIHIVRCLNFCVGNAVKYVMRRGLKEPVRSLKSAEFYLLDQMKRPHQALLHPDAITLLREYALSEEVPEARKFYQSMALYLGAQDPALLQTVVNDLRVLIDSQK